MIIEEATTVYIGIFSTQKIGIYRTIHCTRVSAVCDLQRCLDRLLQIFVHSYTFAPTEFCPWQRLLCRGAEQ